MSETLYMRISTQNIACSQAPDEHMPSFSYILWAYGEHIMSKWSSRTSDQFRETERVRDRDRERAGKVLYGNCVLISTFSFLLYSFTSPSDYCWNGWENLEKFKSTEPRRRNPKGGILGSERNMQSCILIYSGTRLSEETFDIVTIPAES